MEMEAKHRAQRGGDWTSFAQDSEGKSQVNEVSGPVSQNFS